MPTLWREVCHGLSQIIGVRVPLTRLITLLFDFGCFKLQNYKVWLDDVFTEVSMLIAKAWKLKDTPTLDAWIDKMRSMCLMSKLITLCKYRAVDEWSVNRFMCQWAPFINSQFVRSWGKPVDKTAVRQIILVIVLSII